MAPKVCICLQECVLPLPNNACYQRSSALHPFSLLQTQRDPAFYLQLNSAIRLKDTHTLNQMRNRAMEQIAARVPRIFVLVRGYLISNICWSQQFYITRLGQRTRSRFMLGCSDAILLQIQQSPCRHTKISNITMRAPTLPVN